MDQEQERVSFQVKTRLGKNGVIENAVFIDDELLDWQVDLSSLFEAKKMGPAFFRAALLDMEKHYIDAVSETLGRKVTYRQILDATKSGWI